jgi:glyoxylase-like metal-dependent hydrolase (beta-lactamase superfamily II)
VIRFEAGGVRISVLNAGSVWLDGGAMFGVVPRPLWERERAPDERGRIRLALNVLLIEDGRQRILVDTGCGTEWDPKSRDIYNIQARTPRQFLEDAGLTPDRIDLVVNTHLHFDHAGGNLETDGRGQRVPAFPNARYVIQRGELDFARRRNERTRASYLEPLYEPLAAAGRFRKAEGRVQLTRSLFLEPAPGHTPHMQIVRVSTPERTVAFMADLVPTASHVPYAWIMAYDVEPLATLASKRRLLPQAAREGWLLVFQHDAELPVGVLEEQDGRLVARDAGVGV